MNNAVSLKQAVATKGASEGSLWRTTVAKGQVRSVRHTGRLIGELGAEHTIRTNAGKGRIAMRGKSNTFE